MIKNITIIIFRFSTIFFIMLDADLRVPQLRGSSL